MRELIEEFNAASEDGRVFQMQVYIKKINAGTSENPGATIDGLK
jgi:hypothetical protein